MSFKFIDLFAGIGGFHGALSALGGQCVYASEFDPDAARIYHQNWGLQPRGDITFEANDHVMKVPRHDVLVGGFPCQPFSKSGKQKGMEEARGTLFWNIAKIIEVRKPKLVLLENVRNIAGPRHMHEWDVIIQTLRQLGYRVSNKPFIVTPHKIHPSNGGRPQVRERVFIAATRLDKKNISGVSEEIGIPDSSFFYENWDPQHWKLSADLPIDRLTGLEKMRLELTAEEKRWVEAWQDFVFVIRKNVGQDSIPGFPLWVDSWIDNSKIRIPPGTPAWKENFLRKNASFYTENKKILNEWLARHGKLMDFPPSRRKFEWQAQDAKSIDDCILHFRPSGIRVKKATYAPALVAITQTSILGKQRRRMSVRESARLQGFPEWFDFLDQSEALSYRQLGNAVNVGAVYNALKALVVRDLDLLTRFPDLTEAILGSSKSPDDYFTHFQM